MRVARQTKAPTLPGDQTMATVKRDMLITLLVEASLSLAQINAKLAEEGHTVIGDVEAKLLGLTVPDTIPADIAALANEPEVKAVSLPNPLAGIPALPLNLPAGASLGDNGLMAHGPVVGKHNGQSVHAFTAAVTKVTSMVASLIKEDPAAYKTYKAIKDGTVGGKPTDPERDRKARAYAWAFARLLQLGYLLNG